MTSAPDFKSCVVLSSPSIEEMLLTDGVAYYVSFSVGAVFVALCGIMHYMRERSKSYYHETTIGGGGKVVKLAQLSLFQLVVKAALPGFSFGGETTLIVSIMPESPGLAGVMLVNLLIFALLASRFEPRADEDDYVTAR